MCVYVAASPALSPQLATIQWLGGLCNLWWVVLYVGGTAGVWEICSTCPYFLSVRLFVVSVHNVTFRFLGNVCLLLYVAAVVSDNCIITCIYLLQSYQLSIFQHVHSPL